MFSLPSNSILRGVMLQVIGNIGLLVVGLFFQKTGIRVPIIEWYADPIGGWVLQGTLFLGLILVNYHFFEKANRTLTINH